jgi:fermentation-respiration switch protein FrsA (DUF1100 family)
MCAAFRICRRFFCVIVLAGAVAQVGAAVAPGAPQPLMFGEHRIEWLGADRAAGSGNEIAVSLKTNSGRIAGRYHPAMGDGSRRNHGVIWFSGAGGGVDGPARGLYAEASRRLQQQGIASLRLDYRRPQDLPGCVLDALCGIAFFAGEGISRVALVGQSFGGAVAICAGASSPRVRTVVAMSSQTAGSVQMAPLLSPRSLLVMQGTRDKVLPVANARKIFEAAREPKELRYLPEAGHNLIIARAEVLEVLMRWIPEQLGRPVR